MLKRAGSWLTATPLISGTGEPNAMPSIRNWTDPEGVAALGALAETTAEADSGWP